MGNLMLYLFGGFFFKEHWFSHISTKTGMWHDIWSLCFRYTPHKWTVNAFFLEMMLIAGMEVEMLTCVLVSILKALKNCNHMFQNDSSTTHLQHFELRMIPFTQRQHFSVSIMQFLQDFKSISFNWGHNPNQPFQHWHSYVTGACATSYSWVAVTEAFSSWGNACPLSQSCIAHTLVL